MVRRFFLIAFALAFGWSARADEQAEYLKAQYNHPVRTEAFWRKQPQAANLTDRVRAAPVELADYLVRENQHMGFSESPKPGAARKLLVDDVRRAIERMPKAVRMIAERYVEGIFLIADLGTSAFSDRIHDERGNPKRFLIVLDELKVDRSANEWATWKENTPFQSMKGATLKAKIEESTDDNRVQTIQYILLHELGHIVSNERQLDPSWNLQAAGDNSPERFPFSSLSWRSSDDGLRSIYDAEFWLRSGIEYYKKSELSMTTATLVYDQLAKTSFPALYAATNPWDDFAESFATYVHVVMQRKPWQISIVPAPGEPERRYHACWGEKRCSKKRAIIEATLKAYERESVDSRKPAGTR